MYVFLTTRYLFFRDDVLNFGELNVNSIVENRLYIGIRPPVDDRVCGVRHVDNELGLNFFSDVAPPV